MAGLAERLTAELTWLAICWRVVRLDGVALGFTTHDKPLVVDGLCFESAPGMAPSAVVCDDGLDVDTMDVAGALTADAISRDDLVAGRFDGAAVDIFMVDWRAPDAGRQLLTRATLGKIEAGSSADAGFVATVRGLTAALEATSVEAYSPQCRAELGDRRCRVPMRGRSVRVSVGASYGWGVPVADLILADFIEGRFRVIDGPLAGIELRIISASDDALILDDIIDLAAGTTVQIWQGCDKQFSTCTNRFGNGANFRGEPHVPGGDLLTRFGS